MTDPVPSPDDAPDEAYLRRWARIARSLTWFQEPAEVYRPREPYGDWFPGGRLNLAVNCLDRHVDGATERVAVLWEGEPGDRRTLTYRDLLEETVRVAAAFRGMGVRPGDRVALHLGWVPEAVVSMLACARIGAEYTVIPVALPGEALALRLEAFGPRILVTQDGGWRHGTVLPLKARADEALEATSGVQHTVVVRRTGIHVDWFEGDLWYDDLVTHADPALGGPEPLDSAAALVAVHLANRRGRPVAVCHGTANLAVAAEAIHAHGVGDGEVFWCAGDVSWLGAQAHGVLGPLLAGGTAVMYEGTLDVPDPARTWRMVEHYGVSSLMTSPSIVRALRGWSLAVPDSACATLRRFTTIGERLEPELREWLTRALGPGVRIADGWGQLELGGLVAFDDPVDRDGLPDPDLAVVDAAGRPVADGSVGQWVMRRPWPGTMRGATVDGADPTAYHWTRFPGMYASGDLARRLAGGRVEFLGRVDEVVSISGQLVSLNEVREALEEQPFVSRADVFERADPVAGRSLAAALVLEPEAPPVTEHGLRELQDAVRDLLGGLSRPRALLVVDRIGDELGTEERHRALSALASSGPLRVTWEQVLATAGR